ncbi:MAG: putative toxin-antitoxin system toxin component, PIN family [Treponema sp.]|jgi:putative PIN family toxin of toxin-antitoxin system|nr:putative toxin-antitoxin system toxin component, PIN family [Treponema sp.]
MPSGKNEKVKQKVIKVVLDTNILVSSLLTSGPPAVIVDLVADGKIVPFYSNPILQEYWEVLSRKKFGFDSVQVTRLMDDIVKTGIAVEGKQLNKNKKVNQDDRIFYDAAVEAKAYLITGNMKHFPKESFITTPVQFLTIIAKLY